MIKSLLCALLTSLCAHAPAQAGDYLEYEELQAVIEQSSQENGYTREELEALFAQVTRQNSVLTAISRPAEGKDWKTYRPLFLNQQRIEGGVEFWNLYQAELDRAAQTYGVPPEIILAILGVETRFGGNKGSFRVVEALTTLAMDYPPRSPFFRKELREFLKLSKQEGLDPWETRGSYAGAMGFPQFMPSSWNNLAIDFDGDGKRDLLNNPVDAIGSIANYFQKNGWKTGAPVALKARITSQNYDSAVSSELQTNSTILQLRAKGLEPGRDIPDTLPASAIRLQGNNGGEFWITLDNFYVITRYNRSILYAMAVWQLSEAIRNERELRLAAPQPVAEGTVQ